MDFKVGDKIYKIINGNVDDTTMYQIIEISEREEGNYHDGFYTIYIAFILPIESDDSSQKMEQYIIKRNQWGSYKRDYAILVNTYIQQTSSINIS